MEPKEREGLRFSDDDDFESFFRMHRQTAERKGIPFYLSERALRRYFERLRSLETKSPGLTYA